FKVAAAATVGLIAIASARDLHAQRGGEARAAQAQQGGSERSGPAQPPVWLPDEDYLRWPLPPSEQAYAKLRRRRIKGYINEITAISRKSRDDGNQYWGRITGTSYDSMTTEGVAAQFKRMCPGTRIQEFT